MDVIVAYLETMFSPYPATPRLEEAKAELRAMMEDKYSELLAQGRSHNEAVGQVITEFGNLDELAPVLGISSDLRAGPTPGATGVPDGSGPVGTPHRPDSPAAPYRTDSTAPGGTGTPTGTPTGAAPGTPAGPQAPASPPTPVHRVVTLEEAQAFADARHRTRWSLTCAVALFVISPVVLVVLSTMSGSPLLRMDDTLVTGTGIAVLLLLVVAGVSLLIRRNQELAPFERLSEGEFTRDPAVSAWAQQLRAASEPRRTTALMVAVALWILCAVPTIAGGLISDHSAAWADAAPGIGVGLTLVMVALGLLVLLPASWAHSVAEVLTDEGDLPSGHPEQRGSRLVGAFAAAYWPLLTAVFLAWSFLGNAWDRSWLIWPLGALVFAAIAGGIGAWQSRRN